MSGGGHSADAPRTAAATSVGAGAAANGGQMGGAPVGRPDSPRSRLGWYLYDWANSAYATVILAALLPVYFAEGIVGAEGVRAFGLHWSATSLWGYVSGLAGLIVFLTAPYLGALADLTARRRQGLLSCMLPGAAGTAALWFVGRGDVALALVLYLLSSVAFVSANIFYDAFLPYLGPPAERDRISARGYACGYVGGGLLFALCLVAIQIHATLGLDRGTAVRLSLSAAGLWWGGFGLWAWRWMVEPAAVDRSARSAGGEAFAETGNSNVATRGGGTTVSNSLSRAAFLRALETGRQIFWQRELALFMLAFLLYNDGVQTVVKMASIYGKEELGLPTGTLLGTLLMVQVIGAPGALLFARLAGRIGARRGIMLSLVVWLVVVLWSWRLSEAWEFWCLGGLVGLSLGATQALSRSFFAGFIPEGRSAEYYGFYSVFTKLSAVGGPILFAFIRQATGSARYSILALGAFFLVGLLLLAALGRISQGAFGSRNPSVD